MKGFFIRFRLPVIIIGTLVVFMIVAVVIGMLRGHQTQKQSTYFDSSYYPVETRENGDGSMDITLDGSLTRELTWRYENSDPELIEVTEETEEKEGVLTIKVTPTAIGYPKIFFSREGEINGHPYTAGEIIVQLLVSDDDNGKLHTSMSDIYQHQSYVGAADSDTPFLVQGDRVLKLKGGDWELSLKHTDEGVSEDTFEIYDGSEDGIPYTAVYVADRSLLLDGASAEFVLKSEALDYEQSFNYEIDENGDGILKAVQPDGD